MTVADVSTGNQDAVGPFQKRLEQEAMIHPAGTHQPDQPGQAWIESAQREMHKNVKGMLSLGSLKEPGIR